jgi:phage terminase large subunit
MKKFVYTKSLSKIRKLTKRIKVIQGSSSAGKTIAILSILIDKALKNPNTSISVVSETMPHLKRGCIRDFISILKATNRFSSTQWNISNSTYKFLNGSYIEFFSCEASEKLRGARRDVLYINESNLIARDSYLELAMRTNGDIYMDYNPTFPFWNKEVLSGEDAELLILTYKDNAALDENTIKFLESKLELSKTSSYWENWCRVYLFGLEGSIQGTIFTDFEIIDKIPEEARLIGMGLDWGYSNDPAALVAIYKYNDDIVVDELIYETGLLNSELASRMKGLEVKGEIFCDSAEPKSIQELKRYGFQVKPAEKGKDSVNYGIQILQQKHMLVTRRSKNLLDEFSKYMWKKNRDGGFEPTPIDAYNHACDALRYVAMMKLGVRKESSGRLPFQIMSNH